jgi:hypothetical protein
LGEERKLIGPLPLSRNLANGRGGMGI